MMPSVRRRGAGREPRSRIANILLLGLILGLGICASMFASSVRAVLATPSISSFRPGEKTMIGINLTGLANFNRQPVFANLIAQSEWYSAGGDGWKPMPQAQLDRLGWVRRLERNQTAPRPLMLPQRRGRILVDCTYQGRGSLAAGGAARIVADAPSQIHLELDLTGQEDEGAWIELTQTDAGDYVRNIDCREKGVPAEQRFDPEFLAYVAPFGILRFLDWQRTNDNQDALWPLRTLPQSASQTGPQGASIEDMVDLANQVGADPWFLMPYKADAAYVRGFAKLVHDRLDPSRTVYVELGNEVWNEMFDVAQQARREGEALDLGGGDPTKSQTRRYAQKVAGTMKIWSAEFADRPGRLVRVAASQNANPYLTRLILEHGDTAKWVDAVAVAPYIWLDLDGLGTGDVDRIFARLPAEIEATIAFAEQNGAIAARHGKRLIAYEGGQHLVTQNLTLARALQRDPRMAAVYAAYLKAWDARIGDALTLYASTAPISVYGSWGLREYAGQPIGETPKRRAVLAFMEQSR